MCTFFTLHGEDFFAGRNMDIEYSFGETLVITPRNYPWKWRKEKENNESFAVIGMATVMDGMPLYAEGANEKGLIMASLNFPGNAKYLDVKENHINVTPFELIPYILTNYKTVKEVREIVDKINLFHEPFKPEVPLAPLHFIVTDQEDAIVLEPMEDGLHIYDNPIGVLTNNPPFPYQMANLENYSNLQVENPKSTNLHLGDSKPFGQGLGGVGLPGDASPMSRFVRTAFYKNTSHVLENSEKNMMQVFHILDSVKMVRGSVKTPEGKWDVTTYSACINATKGVYYFKTYDNPQVYRCSLFHVDLNEKELYTYSLPKYKEPISINE
ncbi:MAG: choloylglycine hydrolase [Tissierellia bacterium]|nr:choloylglycine hydrolase [Tissierellia bacterium]